jgi:hypothetical protein
MDEFEKLLQYFERELAQFRHACLSSSAYSRNPQHDCPSRASRATFHMWNVCCNRLNNSMRAHPVALRITIRSLRMR